MLKLKFKINSKKGMEMGFIVGIIIILVAFVIIAGTITRFMSKAEPKEAEILCHDSIALRTQTQINVDSTIIGGNLKPVPVLCKTIDQKISGSREDLIEQVAYSMARCWWMFGEGRYEEVLDESDLSLLPSVFGFESLENQCFNCYTILIDQDEIEGGSIKAEEVANYMYTHNHPKFQNLTYLDYVQSYGGPGMFVLGVDVIGPRTAYSVSFAPKNKEESGSSVWGIVKAAGGALLVAGVAGLSIACTIGTVGGCAPFGVAATAAALGAAGITGVALSASGVNTLMANMIKERETSTVFLLDLGAGQEQCGSGDLGGD